MIQSWLALAAILALATVGSAFAAEPETVSVDIPEQPLRYALNQLAQQANIEVVFYTDLGREVVAKRVKGQLTPEAALQQLLDGSGLAYEYIAERTVAILPSRKVGALEKKTTSLQLAQAEATTASEPVPSPAPAREGVPQDDSEVMEIVVTAQKRLQRLQDVPAGVSVVSGATIENMGADSVRDFLQFTPGLSVDHSGEIGNQIQIRGVNAQTGAASVGFYMDDLPFSFINLNFLPDPSPYDLESVQVLRGPQGALYGAGSAGGVVLVSTADPQLDAFGGKAEASSGSTRDGETNYSVSGALNVPLIEDKLAVRGVLSYQNNSGWIEDTLGQNGRNLKDEQRLNARLKVRAKPMAQMSVQLIGAVSRIGRGLAADLADDSNEYPESYFGYEADGEEDYEQYGAVVTYDFGRFTARNATSYLDYDAPFSFPYIAYVPLLYAAEVFANELRLNSKPGGGPFDWVAGFYLRNARQIVFQDLSSLGLPFNNDDHGTSKQYSLFGEATFKLGERVDLSAGGSYFTDDTQNRANLAPGEPDPVFSKVDTDQFSPQVSVTFHPSEESSIYARYAEGFRAGTIDFSLSTYFAQLSIPGITGTVDAENIKAYEIGTKADFLDRRLHAELALFYNDVDNVQQSAFVVDAATNVSATTILNAGKSRSKGVEWVLGLTPVNGFSAELSGAYTDAGIARDFYAPGRDPATSEPLFRKGSPIYLVPEWIVGLRLSYEWNLGSSGLAATLSSSSQYSAGRPLTQLGAAATYGDDILRTDLRLEIAREGKWGAFAFADNVSNEQDIITPYAYSATFVDLGAPVDRSIGSRARPRTLGLGFRMQF
jgi:iron complex outermembrane recepter protein